MWQGFHTYSGYSRLYLEYVSAEGEYGGMS
jgi:hypothetical protein